MTEPVILPCKPDSEKAFLCSLILWPELIERCISLNRAIFHIPAHQILFRMLLDLNSEAKMIDFLTCKTWLKDHDQLEEIGGKEYLDEVWSFVPSAAGWDHYLGVLKEQYVRRQTYAACQKLGQRMLDPLYESTESIQQEVESCLSSMVAEVREKPRVFDDIIDEAYAYLETEDPKGTEGVQFGIPSLDEQLGGIRAGEIAVICAEVSAGKTALGMQAAIMSALQMKPVAIFSFEMSSTQLAFRMISQIGNIRMQSLRRRTFDSRERTKLMDMKSKLKKHPFHIVDSFDQNINGLINSCRQIHAKEPLELVVVDYIQLVTPVSKKGDSREREVADISRKLKKMSVELGVSVIALSQLNENGKMRESRAIAQDADIILRIDTSKSEEEDLRDIVIDKQRSGPRGQRIPVRFLGEYVTFEDNPDEGTVYRSNGSTSRAASADA